MNREEILADLAHLERKFTHACDRAEYWHEHGREDLAIRNQQRAIAIDNDMRKLERQLAAAYPRPAA